MRFLPLCISSSNTIGVAANVSSSWMLFSGPRPQDHLTTQFKGNILSRTHTFFASQSHRKPGLGPCRRYQPLTQEASSDSLFVMLRQHSSPQARIVDLISRPHNAKTCLESWDIFQSVVAPVSSLVLRMATGVAAKLDRVMDSSRSGQSIWNTPHVGTLEHGIVLEYGLSNY
ncbi:uncharacterized protein EI97DRAFT_189271 [Westerdykella ornata]|uniref:Uncharacterized protein n=1 Tax=Westerdykella ornata TaxID=318751 RepID=A0A6A6JAA9_WESOR|nr:uncharacterized protein EI97DRAFT_189271 [Westerdykella ornata]KAF2273103.1 hypothetical protein EI97DRAFT_189271 [Westerdykella ornata]